MKNPNNILITGATSGLGRALALVYAKEGAVLYLTGRNQGRLADIKNKCESKGAKVVEKCLDVANAKEMQSWIDSIYLSGGKVDLVIANAGISAGTEGGSESVGQVRKIFATNIDGVVNTIHPVMEYMKQERKGQIVIISSLAGFRGLPSSPAYSASKAAVRVYGEGLRGSVAKDGIGVTVVAPGYIKTPMTDVNKFPMPFIIGAGRAARLIARKLKRNPSRIAFPFRLYFVVWLLSILPPCLTDPVFSRMPGKKGLGE